MKITQAGVTTAIALFAPAAASLLTELVNEKVISAQIAAIIGGFIATLAAGWHGNAAVAKRQAAPDLASIVATQAKISDAAGAFGNAVGAALADGKGPQTPAPQAQP